MAEELSLKGKKGHPKGSMLTSVATVVTPKKSNLHGERATEVFASRMFSIYTPGVMPMGRRRVAAYLFCKPRYYGTDCTRGVKGSSEEPLTNNVRTRLQKLYARSLKYPEGTFDNNLHTLISNKELLNMAYNNIRSKLVNCNSSIYNVSDDTLDIISDKILVNIVTSISNESFQFKPVRKLNIKKPLGGTRELSIGYLRDNIVQEAIRMILEAIYEPIFSNSSHGFRKGKNCHTALDYVSKKFTSTN